MRYRLRSRICRSIGFAQHDERASNAVTRAVDDDRAVGARMNAAAGFGEPSAEPDVIGVPPRVGSDRTTSARKRAGSGRVRHRTPLRPFGRHRERGRPSPMIAVCPGP